MAANLGFEGCLLNQVLPNAILHLGQAHARRNVSLVHRLLFLQAKFITAGAAEHHLQHLHVDFYLLYFGTANNATLHPPTRPLRS